MQASNRCSTPSIVFDALDLIAQLEMKLAELDNDLVRGLIPTDEAENIRKSISGIISRLEATLGARHREIRRTE
jgi:hypothetical protein